MKLKQKLYRLLKYVGTVGCLTVIPIANAQSQVNQQGQPNQTVRRTQQRIMQAVEEAPRLLSSKANVNFPPYPQETVARRPQVSPRAQRPGYVPSHNRNRKVQLANYPARQTQVFGESIVEGSCSTGGCSTGGCSDCGIGEVMMDPGYEVGCGDMVGCGVDGGISGQTWGGQITQANPCGYPMYPGLISLSDMEFFGGFQAVKGSMNLGRAGSFGFNEGVNWGFPLPAFQGLGLSGQLGVRFTQANPNGTIFNPNSRSQIFVSGGIFRRVDYGLQIGAAYDYLNENWYFRGTYGQIRGEISWVGSYGNTFGFRYTVEMEEEPGIGAIVRARVPGTPVFNTFSPIDTYRFFYEQNFAQSGAKINGWGGFTGNSEGLIGVDARLPVTDRFMVHATGSHLITSNIGANIDEAWNVGVNLVFMPKGWSKWKRAYHRPMFDVADNGSFLIGRN